jgi:hypothetical protein
MINKEDTQERRKRFLLAIAAVTWVVIVTSAYFAVHKPGSPAQLGALARATGSVAGVLMTLSVATVLGLPWRRALDGLEARSQIALQLGAGMAGLSFLALSMGALGAYHPTVAWGIATISLPFSLRQWIGMLREGRIGLPSGRANRWLAAFVLGLISLAAVSALAPPTAWDSLVYHLTGPKLYLEAGRLTHDLDLPYLGFPQAGSMLFLWGMLLAGDRVPQLIHLSFGLLTLALLPTVVRRVAPGRSWLTAAILLGVPSAQLLLGLAYVEWITAFAGLACFVLLTTGDDVGPTGESVGTGELGRSIGSQRIVRIVLAGLFAALALNTKYSAVWMVAGLGLLSYLRRRSSGEVVLFAASVSTFLIPFFMKNWLLTSNPVYPFFFSGRFWDAYRAAWFSRAGTGLGAGQLLVAPWEATIWGLEGGYFEGHPSYGATVGPILLALIPLVLLRLRNASPEQSKMKTALLVLCGTAFVGWLGQLAFSKLLVQTRLLFPVLPEMAILATAGFDRLGSLGRRGRSARFIVGGLVSFTLAITALQAALGSIAASPLRVATGSEPEEEYLRSRLGQYAVAVQAINELPDGSRVRFLWEPRSYYCASAVTCEPDSLIDRWWHERRLGAGAEAPELLTGWRQQGVTHVLYFRLGAEAVRNSGFDPLTDEDWAELERFLSDYLEFAESFGDAYLLYRIP